MTKKKLSKPALAVGEYLEKIQESERGTGTKHKAVLSALRNSAGKNLADSPDLFKMVTKIMAQSGYTVPDDVPVTPEEEAVASALSLYSIHYGSKNRFPHSDGVGFGQALAVISSGVSNTKGEESSLITRYMERLFKSGDTRSYNSALISIIRMAKTPESSFDYSEFTQDLINLQYPERKNRIIMKWTRAFYSNQIIKKEK